MSQDIIKSTLPPKENHELAEDTLARAWTAVTEVTEQETTAAEEHIRDVMKRVINSVEERFSRGSQELRGLPTGPAGNYLDKLVRGHRAVALHGGGVMPCASTGCAGATSARSARPATS